MNDKRNNRRWIWFLGGGLIAAITISLMIITLVALNQGYQTRHYPNAVLVSQDIDCSGWPYLICQHKVYVTSDPIEDVYSWYDIRFDPLVDTTRKPEFVRYQTGRLVTHSQGVLLSEIGSGSRIDYSHLIMFSKLMIFAKTLFSYNNLSSLIRFIERVQVVSDNVGIGVIRTRDLCCDRQSAFQVGPGGGILALSAQ